MALANSTAARESKPASIRGSSLSKDSTPGRSVPSLLKNQRTNHPPGFGFVVFFGKPFENQPSNNHSRSGFWFFFGRHHPRFFWGEGVSFSELYRCFLSLLKTNRVKKPSNQPLPRSGFCFFWGGKVKVLLLFFFFELHF